VQVELTSQPTGATVYRAVDGVKIGQTPFTGEFQRGAGVAELLLVLPGYHSARIELPTDADFERQVVLAAEAPAATASKKERPRKGRGPARPTARETVPAPDKDPAVEKKPLGDKTVDPFGG
jgi:hypothetical protein